MSNYHNANKKYGKPIKYNAMKWWKSKIRKASPQGATERKRKKQVKKSGG